MVSYMTIRGLLLTSTLALATTGIAGATQIVQTFSMPSGSDVTSWTGTASINTFDSTTGTLEDIQVIAALSSSASSGAVDNNGGGPSTYGIDATTNFSLSDPSSEVLITPQTTIGSTFTGQTQGESMAISGSKTDTENNIWLVSSPYSVCHSGNKVAGCLDIDDSSEGSPADLDYLAYESVGASTISLTGNASTAGTFTGSSYSGAYAGGTADVLVTVIYDYIANPPSSTPEPATMALFGTGLVGLGLLRRRFSKKS